MRFLHTSDWHLGRSFHGVGLLAAQQRFIDQLLATVEHEQVDVLLISGDVYDRALPPVDVVRLFSATLARLRAAGVEVVISSGNHDSASRLGFASEILGHGGVHIRAAVADLDRPVLFDGGKIAVYAVPYLEPRMVAAELDVEAPDHESVTAAALRRVHADAAARPGTRTVLMAHTFASGGIGSSSERELSGMRSGGIGAVPLDLFEGFDYVALGHLHGRQRLSESVRYSGSPLAYSFAEADQAKGGWLVELSATGLESVKPISWPAERALSVLRGTLAELLAEPRFADSADAYCQVTLTDERRPVQAMEKLRERFPLTLVLEHEPPLGARPVRQSYARRIAEAQSDLEISASFFEHVRSAPINATEASMLAAAVDEVRAAEGSA
ncbi:exonuclease SbcCD subunit D [Arthrobacter russicus]|uniref:Nuclease SbcCD subunit D n=1 Tax=Arthrobacter russicus TaxID=172040 RepID=A0ABU1J7G7_9MICC|nr:exonuclease SbcCD subunit D [Arthrobacter russicus]MDR6268374.1 exonuclease SbcD [Arthrobacter russicus]